MRHDTAVRRLHTIAEDCDKFTRLLGGATGLLGAYAYGAVLDHPDRDLDAVNLALVVDLAAEELPWGVEPPECTSLADLLRLDKAPVLWRWRPGEWPVANHEIRRPMPIWNRDGVQSAALDALAGKQAEPFRITDPDDDTRAEQMARELATSSAHLRAVRDRYWEDANWRRSHRRDGRHPEDHLWQAVDGYLDLLDASASAHSQR